MERSVSSAFIQRQRILTFSPQNKVSLPLLRVMWFLHYVGRAARGPGLGPGVPANGIPTEQPGTSAARDRQPRRPGLPGRRCVGRAARDPGTTLRIPGAVAGRPAELNKELLPLLRWALAPTSRQQKEGPAAWRPGGRREVVPVYTAIFPILAAVRPRKCTSWRREPRRK